MTGVGYTHEKVETGRWNNGISPHNSVNVCKYLYSIKKTYKYNLKLLKY